MAKYFIIAVLLSVALFAAAASSPASKKAMKAAKNGTIDAKNGTAMTNRTAAKSVEMEKKDKETKSSLTKFAQCPGAPKNISTLHSVEIKDCKGSVCTFKRGEKYYIRVEFTPSQRITDLELNITGIIAKKGVPFAVDNKRLCLDHIREMKNETKCGLKRHVKYHFEYSMDVLSTYPSIALQVAFNVKYGNKNVFCFMFPTKLV